ncbi:acyl carrier protein [Streptomyces rochei]|uniref:acyl carrier protein n=1 Tax=Streptomyces rochei TaxID=1928 RepID=UPI0036A4D55A
MSAEESPADVVGRAVHQAWRAHLPTEDFTVHANFARMGGTSMLAMRIVSERQGMHLVRPAAPGSVGALPAWTKRCSASFVTHDIGGEHYALMSGVHGKRIAQLLAELWLP